MICSFNSDIAKLAGVDAAVVFEYISDKCIVNSPVHLPVKTIAADLSFYTERQVRYALSRLWKLELINRHEISSKVIEYSLTNTGKSYLNKSKQSLLVSNGNLGFVTKKRVFTNIHKINQFIKSCETTMYKFKFNENVCNKLMEYFRYLAEQNCLLPKRTITYQLCELNTLSEENMVIAIERTISHGWKSLCYMVDNIMNTPDKYINTGAVRNNSEVDVTGGGEF